MIWSREFHVEVDVSRFGAGLELEMSKFALAKLEETYSCWRWASSCWNSA